MKTPSAKTTMNLTLLLLKRGRDVEAARVWLGYRGVATGQPGESISFFNSLLNQYKSKSVAAEELDHTRETMSRLDIKLTSVYLEHVKSEMIKKEMADVSYLDDFIS